MIGERDFPYPYTFSIPQNVTKVFISGPMTGYKDWNHELFNSVATELRVLGFTVINPAEFFDGDTTRERADYMRQSVINLLECDMVLLLPGWLDSNGAMVEAAIGLELGLELGELRYNISANDIF